MNNKIQLFKLFIKLIYFQLKRDTSDICKNIIPILEVTSLNFSASVIGNSMKQFFSTHCQHLSHAYNCFEDIISGYDMCLQINTYFTKSGIKPFYNFLNKICADNGTKIEG